MFNPSQEQVREFFCAIFEKQRAHNILTPLETIAGQWIDLHPEYHGDLESLERAKLAQYPPEGGKTNPFLHLSMHLSIAEQISIDQPPGIKQIFDQLCIKRGNAHEASHTMMDCLGEMLWTAQRNQSVPDGQVYVDCLRRHLGKL